MNKIIKFYEENYFKIFLLQIFIFVLLYKTISSDAGMLFTLPCVTFDVYHTFRCKNWIPFTLNIVISATLTYCLLT